METKESILEEVLRGYGVETPIAVFKPACFKAFVRLIKQLVKLHGSRPIYIDNSRLQQRIGYSSLWVDIDLGNFVESSSNKAKAATADMNTKPGQGVSFAFQALGDDDIQGLASMAGGSLNVSVWNRSNGIVFDNGHTELVIQQPANRLSSPAQVLPSASDRLGEDVVVSDLAGLKSYIGKSDLVTLRLYDSQLEQVKIRKRRCPYTLHVASVSALKDREPSQTLTSQYFLKLAGKLQLALGIYRNDLGYWLKISSKQSMVNSLTTYELLYEGNV